MLFRRTFNSGSRIHDYFVGRNDEADALKRAIVEHRKDLHRGCADEPIANNVLVYHGIGGIGKTTLSRRLEQWIRGGLIQNHSWGPAPQSHNVVTARFDLHDSMGNIDASEIVLALRRALSVIKSKWPAFDFAFATWWSAVIQDGTLPQLNELKQSDVTDSIVGTVIDIASDLNVSDLVSGLAGRGIRKLIEAFVAFRGKLTAFGQVDGDPEYIELLQLLQQLPSPGNPRFDLLANLVELLDVELSRLEELPTVVMFIDAFENIQSDDDSKRNAERFFHDLIWRLPHVLFVVTGRNPIHWGSDRPPKFAFSGAQQWPGLASGASRDPRQHLVGYLSKPDSVALLEYLSNELDLELNNVEIEDIALRTNGHPKHIELIAQEIRRRRLSGLNSCDDDIFEATFDQLVELLLSNIRPEGQRIIRSAALFSSFDISILVEATGADVGAVLRALDCPLIDKVDGRMYRMHDTVRVAIRQSDPLIPNGWAESDWQSAARKALGYYRNQLIVSFDNADIESSYENLGAAITLVSAEHVRAQGCWRHSGYEDWLVEMMVLGPGIVPLRSHVPAISSTWYGQAFIDFIEAKQEALPFEKRRELLTAIADSGHPLSVPAKRHLAYELRSRNLYGEAIDVLSELLSVSPTVLNHYQRRYTLVMSRKFEDALLGLPDCLRKDGDRMARLRAVVALAHGDVDGYIESASSKMAKLALLQRMREFEETRVLRDSVCALTSSRVEDSDLAERIRDAQALGQLEHAARLIQLAILNDPFNASANNLLAETVKMDTARGLKLSLQTAFSQLALAYANGDRSAMCRLVNTINSIDHLHHHWIPIEILLRSYGFDLSVPSTQWLEPYVNVEERWLSHWRRWYVRQFVE